MRNTAMLLAALMIMAPLSLRADQTIEGQFVRIGDWPPSTQTHALVWTALISRAGRSALRIRVLMEVCFFT